MTRLIAVATLFAACGTASGDVIISNINAPSTSGTVFGTCASTIYKAGGFTMPVGGAEYSLDAVLFVIDYSNSGGGELGQYSVWSGATPTTKLTTLSTTMPQTGVGTFEFTPDTPVVLEAGETYWVYVEAAVPSTGCMRWEGNANGPAPTGIAVSAGYLFNGGASTFRNRYEVQGSELGGCYADCDGSGTLDFFDFLCFQNEFTAGSSYADCDGSGTLDFFDFLCFQNEFTAGCP